MGIIGETSTVLNEKLGTIRLVTMPSNEFGPLKPLKARLVKSVSTHR